MVVVEESMGGSGGNGVRSVQWRWWLRTVLYVFSREAPGALQVSVTADN